MYTILRIEHKETGIGPYRSEKDNYGTEVYKTLDKHNYSSEHPGPSEEGIFIWENNTLRFGFSSIYQLTHWFNDYERDVLKKHGYIIRRYKVRKYDECKSKKQCVFMLEDVIN